MNVEVSSQRLGVSRSEMVTSDGSLKVCTTHMRRSQIR